jgi:hypothetical protein
MNDQNTIPGWEDLKSAGQVPPPSPEVLAHARRQLDTKTISTRRWTTTRRRMVPVLAAAGSVAVVIGAVAVYQTNSGPVPVGGSTMSVQPSEPASSPTASAPSRKPSQGSAASCVVGYSPAELKKRALAFDGTVLSVKPEPRRGVPQTYLVSFAVNEWFGDRAHVPRQIALVIDRAPGDNQAPSEFGPPYVIGSRLLITGDSSSLGPYPRGPLVVWGCGFSRPYNAADAATWRKILSR